MIGSAAVSNGESGDGLCFTNSATPITYVWKDLSSQGRLSRRSATDPLALAFAPVSDGLFIFYFNFVIFFDFLFLWFVSESRQQPIIEINHCVSVGPGNAAAVIEV